MQTILQMHPDVQYIMSFLYTPANWAVCASVLSATLGKLNRIRSGLYENDNAAFKFHIKGAQLAMCLAINCLCEHYEVGMEMKGKT